MGVLIGGHAFSADGDLDTSYDTDGVNAVSFGGTDNVYGGFLQSDGKLIVVGGARPVNATQEFGVARFNADGSIDTGFATSGKYSLDITTAANATDRATCAGVQSDGKIIVGGYTRTTSGNEDFAIIRLSTAGVLDTTFGTSGVAKVNFNTAGDRATDLAVLSDNSILICGNVFTDTIANGGKSTYGIAKLTAAGVLDTTFGTGGKATLNVGANDDSVAGMDVQSDGKILIAGMSNDKATVVRFTAAGGVDTTFGTNGVFSQHLGASTSDALFDVKFETGGKIVACGTSAPAGSLDVAILRLTSAGALDTTFNTTGYFVNNLGSTSDTLRSLVIQADGKYLAGGFWTNGNLDIAMVRTTSAGALDSTFGIGGIKKLSLAAGSDIITALFVGTDGKIFVAAEGAASTGQENFYAARFLNTVITGPVAPTVQTTAQANVTYAAADLGGDVTATGGATVTDRGIVWATSSGPTIVSGTKVGIGSGSGSFNATVSGLPASTLIYVRAYATNSVNTSYGNEISFTTLVAPAEISVLGNGTGIPSGFTLPTTLNGTDFGSVLVTGASVARTFTITNTGAGALNLTGTPPVTLSGDTTQFTVTAQPTTPVAATSGTTTFTITFDPSSVGAKTATVSIPNNDADESPYTFAIGGTGSVPPPGTLDITLDGDGRLTTGMVPGYGEEAQAVQIQPDGKILVGGFGHVGTSNSMDFIVIRYNADGTLDTSWDMDGAGGAAGGIVTTDFDGGADGIHAMKLQPDGKVVVAGYAFSSTVQFALARYNSDGTLDTSFGTGGKVLTDLPGNINVAKALALQPDGKIVVAGPSGDGLNNDGVVVRYNADGSLDEEFGTDGVAAAGFPNGGEYVAVAIQPVTGRILLVGSSPVNGLNYDIIIDALTPAGVRDTSFGTEGNGNITLDPGGLDDIGRGIAVLPDGSFRVLATVNDGLQFDVYVLGFTAGGEQDTFGYNVSGGTVIDLSGEGADDQAFGIAIRSDGAIVVSGRAGVGTDADFGIAVLKADGSPDDTFDGSGWTRINFAGYADTAYAVTWDAAGNIVAAGSAETAQGLDIAVARLIGPVMPLPEIAVFDGTGTAGAERTDNVGTVAFGSVNTGSSSAAQTFTIQNTGTGELLDLAVTVSGEDDADFTVGSLSAVNLAPNDTATFTVTFSPTSAGLKEAVINIASNDPDENPFEINVSGTGVAAAGEIAVFDGVGTAGTERTDNVGTHAFGAAFTGGGATEQIFTIKNTGTGTLSGIAVTAGGTDGNQFFIDVTGMLTSLLPNETTSFKVNFAPTTAGSKTGVINIASNDEDENPFRIGVSGTANKPTMLIIGTNSYAADVVTKLQATGRFAAVNYFAGQSGTPTLSYLQQHQSVLVFTDDGLQDRVTTGNRLADYVDGGGGLILATFCFEISNFWGMGGRIVTDDYLPISIGPQTGGENLTLVPNIPNHPILNGVNSFNGGEASYHNVCTVKPGATLVASWSDGEPLVAYKPVNGGSKSVMALNFYPPSSDIREDFWDASTDGILLITNCLGFTGGIVAPGGEEPVEEEPEIAIFGNEVEIADGDVTPSLADHTSFGSTAVAGGTVARTFTIENQGAATLTLTGEESVYVTLSGDTDHFTVTTQPSGSVAVEGSTTFVITFDPTSGGTKNAVVSIVSNDADESPYTFAISGAGLAPEPVPSLLNEDVVTNGAAPGPDGTTEIGQFDLLRRGGFLAKNGNLVFPGYLLIGSGSPAVTAANNSGIWKTSGGNLFMLARTGTTVPDVPGAQFATLPEVPGINESGEASFLATLTIGVGGVTTANDTGLWSEVGGSPISLLAREDDAVPGLSNVKIDKFASGLFATAKTGTSTGEAAFSVTYKGASTKTAILRASVNGATTTVSVIAQEGETAPGVTPAATFANVAGNYSDPGRMDGLGNFAFSALTIPGSKEGIWYQPRGGSVAKVFSAGDTAPGTSGATFSKLYRPSMGSNGYITFRGSLSANGDNSANLRNDGIWAGTVAGGFNSILRRGDGTSVVANLPGAGKVGNVWGGWVASSNLGAWKAWLDTDGNGTSAAPTDVHGLYTNLSGAMLLAVKAGDAAPGTAETFTGFDLPVVGGANQYAFLGTLSGAASANQGLWKSTADGGALTLVLRKGDTVDTTEGPKVVIKIDLPGSNQTDRRWEQPVMDDTGRMVVYITFEDGFTSQILVP